MKRLLSNGGALLITGALLDLMIAWGLEKDLPWLRSSTMGAGGMVCLYLLMKYRKQL